LAIDRGAGLLTAALAFSRLSNYCSWQDNGSKKALITDHDRERKAIQDFVRFKELIFQRMAWGIDTKANFSFVLGIQRSINDSCRGIMIIRGHM